MADFHLSLAGKSVRDNAWNVTVCVVVGVCLENVVPSLVIYWRQDEASRNFLDVHGEWFEVVDHKYIIVD